MEQKRRGPQKGASRKWAQRLKEIGQQPPPQDLVDKIKKKDLEKAAQPRASIRDLEG